MVTDSCFTQKRSSLAVREKQIHRRHLLRLCLACIAVFYLTRITRITRISFLIEPRTFRNLHECLRMVNTRLCRLIVPLFIEGQREMSVACDDGNFSSPKSSQEEVAFPLTLAPSGVDLKVRPANVVSKRSAE